MDEGERENLDQAIADVDWSSFFDEAYGDGGMVLTP